MQTEFATGETSSLLVAPKFVANGEKRGAGTDKQRRVSLDGWRVSQRSWGLHFKWYKSLKKLKFSKKMNESKIGSDLLKKIADGLEVELFSLFAFDSDTTAPSRKEIKQLVDNIPVK